MGLIKPAPVQIILARSCSLVSGSSGACKKSSFSHPPYLVVHDRSTRERNFPSGNSIPSVS